MSKGIKTARSAVSKKSNQSSGSLDLSKFKNSLTEFFQNFSWKKVLVVLVVFYLILVVAGAYFIYGKKSTDGFARSAVKFFPYPAAVSLKDGIWISYKDFLKRYDTTIKFYQTYYQNNSIPENNEIKNRLREEALNYLIEKKMVQKLAKKFNIEVKENEVNDRYQQILDYYNKDEAKLKEELNKIRGITIEEYKNEIQNQILTEKLQEKVLNEEKVYTEARQKAEDILKRIQNGEDFAKLADELSDKISNTGRGGDVGYIYKDKPEASGERVMFYLTEAREAIFSLKVGEISDVVKTDFGYHIFKVLERDTQKVRLAQIWIKTPSFSDWLKQKIDEAKFKKLVL